MVQNLNVLSITTLRWDYEFVWYVGSEKFGMKDIVMVKKLQVISSIGMWIGSFSEIDIILNNIFIWNWRSLDMLYSLSLGTIARYYALPIMLL